jgi:Na+/proline symporter
MNIDLAVVVIYLLTLLVLTLVIKRKSNSLIDFGTIAVDQQSNKLLLTATLFTTAVGGATTFGIAEKVFSYNLSYSYALIAASIFDVLIARYLLPRFDKFYGAVTVGDIIYKYYGNLGKIVTGAAGTIVTLGYLAAQINVGGYLLNYFLNMEFLWGVIVSYLIIVSYTLIGGLRAVVSLNLLQFGIMVIAMPLMLAVGIYSIDGTGNLNPLLMREHIINKYSMQDPKLLYDGIAAMLGFSVMGLFPTFIQKLLMNKHTEIIQKAIYNKIILNVFYIVIVSGIGLVASMIMPVGEPNHAIFYLIDVVMPVGIKGIVIAGLMAAVFSTGDSCLNVASVTMTGDVIKPLFAIDSERKLVNTARTLTILVSFVAIWLAFKYDNVVDLVLFVAGFWAPITFVPLIFCLYGIHIRKTGYILTVGLSLVSFAIWEIFYLEQYLVKSLFIGTFVCFISFLIWLFVDYIEKQGYFWQKGQ